MLTPKKESATMLKRKKKKSSLFDALRTFINQHWFMLLVIVIFMLATLLRTYNFPNRWGIGNDDARDVAIAQEALRRHELPLIGSFSSAGPFVFGPFFYWFIMGSYIVLPFAFTAPWIMLAFSGVLTVGILMLTAYKLDGKIFALFVGVLTALSPQLVFRSLSLGQHTFIALLTSLLLFFLVLLYKKPRLLYALLFGIVLGSAINFHYQALNLLLYLPVLFFLPKLTIPKRFIMVGIAGVGILLGLLPLLIWDSHQEFANFRNLFDYLLIGQHRLYVPNSWRLFLFTYLPQYWSLVIGGYKWIGLLLMVLTGTIFISHFLRRKLPTVWLFLIVPFGILLLINKYYKGERSEGYLLYFLPLIILCTAYAIYRIFLQTQLKFSMNKILGGALLSGVLLGNILVLSTFLTWVSPVKDFERTISEIAKKYPGEKFVVYDYKYSSPYHSQPMSILLSKHDLADRKGRPIGVVCYVKCPIRHPVIASMGAVAIVDLSNEASLSAQKKDWGRLNPEDMYDDLIGWSKSHELTTTFSLQRYFLDKFHLR